MTSGSYADGHSTPLRVFHGSLVVVGLGAAFVDTSRGGSNQYYTGFALLFLGFSASFLISVRAVLRPAGLFMAAILLEAYGWWNVFWSGIILWRVHTLPMSVALARYPSVGVISIPLWEFFLSTILAILLPIGLTRYFGKFARLTPALNRIRETW